MFAAMSTIIIQGLIPSHTIGCWKVIYAVSNGLAFGALLLSLVICIEILSLASRFMIFKAKLHANMLGKARRNTKKFFDQIQEKNFSRQKIDEETKSASPQEISSKQPEEETKEYVSIASAGITATAINEIWDHIEADATTMLADRRLLVNSLVTAVTFDAYWESTCSIYFRFAVGAFYFGTIFMLISTMIFFYFLMEDSFKNKTSAIIGSVFIGLSIFQSLRIVRSIKRKEEYASLATANLSRMDEVEVLRKDSCCCCPYWEKAILLSPYSEKELMDVEFKDSMNAASDNRDIENGGGTEYIPTGETDKVSYTRMRKSQFNVVQSTHYNFGYNDDLPVIYDPQKEKDG